MVAMRDVAANEMADTGDRVKNRLYRLERSVCWPGVRSVLADGLPPVKRVGLLGPDERKLLRADSF